MCAAQIEPEYLVAECVAYTPECESAQVIKTKWHYGKDNYNQINCCKKHQLIRDGMTELWDALDHFGHPSPMGL